MLAGVILVALPVGMSGYHAPVEVAPFEPYKPLSHGYVMGMSWICHRCVVVCYGYVVDLSWICRGLAIGVSSVFHGWMCRRFFMDGCVVGLSWICRGFVIGVSSVCHRYVVGLSWMYRGYVMDIPDPLGERQFASL